MRCQVPDRAAWRAPGGFAGPCVRHFCHLLSQASFLPFSPHELDHGCWWGRPRGRPEASAVVLCCACVSPLRELEEQKKQAMGWDHSVRALTSSVRASRQCLVAKRIEQTVDLKVGNPGAVALKRRNKLGLSPIAAGRLRSIFSLRGTLLGSSTPPFDQPLWCIRFAHGTTPDF
jgi:hypothetical protein